MFNWLKKIFSEIKILNTSISNYKSDTIVPSLPTVGYVNKAKKYIENKQYVEAEKLLLEALDISSEDALVFKYLGKIKEVQLNFKEALNNYKQSAKFNQNDKEIWLRLGMTQLNLNQTDEALESFEKANIVTPMNTDVYTGWGMAYMKLKKYANAKDKFVIATQINKYNYTSILLSAVMEGRLGEYDSAELKLEFLNKVAMNESSTYEYANIQFFKEKYNLAEEYALKSIKINKKMLPTYLLLGDIYSTTKDIPKLFETLYSALENDLDSEILHSDFGKYFIRIFNFEQAEIEYQQTLIKNPENKEAQIGLALLNAYKNDFTSLENLKEKYASNSLIQEAIGLEYFYSNKISEAIDFFNKALKTDKKQTYNLINLARCYVKLNDKQKAKDYYEKFTAENLNYIMGYIEYAKWLTEINDYKEALRKLRKAENLSPNNLEVLNLIFISNYSIVKDNICEYNIKETLSIAEKIKSLGFFNYEKEENELIGILNNL